MRRLILPGPRGLDRMWLGCQVKRILMLLIITYPLIALAILKMQSAAIGRVCVETFCSQTIVACALNYLGLERDSSILKSKAKWTAASQAL